MTKKMILLAFAATLPLRAHAGACMYTTEAAAGKAQTHCTYVDDEAHCSSLAAQKASPAWLEAHASKYVAKQSCNSVVNPAQPAKRAKNAVATKKTVAKKSKATAASSASSEAAK